jgi:hypothetical protein
MIVCIQAGNTDNKLTQQEWASFVEHINATLAIHQQGRYFFGGSETYAPWQNVCFVCEVDPTCLNALKTDLAQVRASYKQDSIAMLSGKTEFI